MVNLDRLIKLTMSHGTESLANKAYDESWNRIFGPNPVAKQVRTPKFKSQVVASKKVYNRKRLNDQEE